MGPVSPPSQSPTAASTPSLPKGSTVSRNSVEPPYTSYVEEAALEPTAPSPPLDSEARVLVLSAALPWFKTVHPAATHNPLTSLPYTVTELDAQAATLGSMREKYLDSSSSNNAHSHGHRPSRQKDRDSRRTVLIRKRDELARKVEAEFERINRERNELDKEIGEMTLQHELERRVWLKQRDAKKQRDEERRKKEEERNKMRKDKNLQGSRSQSDEEELGQRKRRKIEDDVVMRDV